MYTCTCICKRVGVPRRSMSLLEEEISLLKETIRRQGYSLSTFENEKQELVNDVEVAKTTVSPVYIPV